MRDKNVFKLPFLISIDSDGLWVKNVISQIKLYCLNPHCYFLIHFCNQKLSGAMPFLFFPVAVLFF
jgi:hypothetical protein